MITPSPIQAGGSINIRGSYSWQKNVETDNLNSYGYMYSAYAGNADIMDYYTEKKSTYNKRDVFLGIPFNNADQFSVTGEGIGGAFRMYNRNAGHFHPNYKESNIDIINAGVETELGINNGAGGDIGVGYQKMFVGSWSNRSSFLSPETGEENVFFRFNSDLGGEVSYGSEQKQQAKIIGGVNGYLPDISAIETSMNEGELSGRSSYIGYNTNSVLNQEQHKAYNKEPELLSASGGFINRAETANNFDKTLGEFSISNSDGTNYNYGLPVYSRNEEELHYGLMGIGGNNIEHNFKAYRNIESDAIKTEVGQKSNAAYANAFLLTSITTPDYIDIDYNGPSRSDFGGWTKFIYKQHYGSVTKNGTSGNWYKWRSPYNGLSYSRGELSTANDDMGGVLEGEKEIYYLDTVKTKTHFAKFHTSNRLDGIDAEHNPSTASSYSTAAGLNTLQKLDSISLYAYRNDGTPELIKKVHFQYSYELAKELPNSNGTAGNNGKLTLKKVWFEYNGVVNAKIAPYQFEYIYPKLSNGYDYPVKYNALEDYGIVSETPKNENPDYSPFALDPWGNYQLNGTNRFDAMQTWIDQNPSNTELLDPAAWQLKVIKLPSGGEIHIQYEQDDYMYVQDKLAHAMVSLKNAYSDDENAKYYLNVNEIGISEAEGYQLQELKSLINTLYIKPNKKVYFKFLYQLLGSELPGLASCNAEYIDGYVNISDVGIDPVKGLWVELGSSDVHDLPKKVCKDFVRTQRAGTLREEGNCNPDAVGIFNSDDPEAIARNLLNFLKVVMVPNNTCLTVNYDLSYLRLPVVNPKKGGGIRVKRLMMYDKGIESGYPALYGSEYEYKTFDNNLNKYITSGVATNEPASIREENKLTDFIPRGSKEPLGKIISGRDKKQSEGPLGESILPSPSVGYSKVIVKNIHSGKTNTGFTIKEFHTVKTHPFRVEMTDIDEKNGIPIIIPAPFVSTYIMQKWTTQGFAFYKNDMHGRMISSISYAGDYNNSYDLSKGIVSSELITYYAPGEEVPVMEDITSTAPYPKKSMGTEMDLVFESQFVRDQSNDIAVEGDIDAGMFGPFPVPFVSVTPSSTYTQIDLSTHVTTKVINYPAIVKSKTVFADGIDHVTKNIAHDPLTGDPLVTQTYDGFHNEENPLDLLASTDHNGTYTQYKIPASQQYVSMGTKAGREGIILDYTGANTTKKIDPITGETYIQYTATPPATVCDNMAQLEEGDLIQLTNNNGEWYHVGKIIGSRQYLEPTSYNSSNVNNLSNFSINIVRSGRQNLLTQFAGSYTTYGAPQAAQSLSKPIDPLVLAERQAVANQLNTIIQQGDYKGAIAVSDLSADIINPATNTCGTSYLTDSIVLDFSGVAGSLSYSGEYGTEELLVNPEGNTTCPLDANGELFIGNPESCMNPANSVLMYAQNGGDGRYQKEVRMKKENGVTTYYCGYWPKELSPKSRPNKPLYGVYNNVAFKIKEPIEYNGKYELRYDFCVLDHNIGSINTRASYINEDMALNNDFSTGGQVVESVVLGFPAVCTTLVYKHNILTPGIENLSDYMALQADLNVTLGDMSTNQYLNVSYANVSLTKISYAPICEETFHKSGGQGAFSVDANTGKLVYYTSDNPCYAIEVECVQFCEDVKGGNYLQIPNVVAAANAATFNNYWPFSIEQYYTNSDHSATAEWNNLSTLNEYEKGSRGKWRKEADYIYKSDTLSGGENYLAGLYTLELFNWQKPSINATDWLRTSKTTAYSPNGNALEEENVLGIKSTAKFGYQQTLPYLMVQNGGYKQAHFESFENVYKGKSSGTDKHYLEDGVLYNPALAVVDNTTAHSGKQSLRIVNAKTTPIPLMPQYGSAVNYEKGVKVMFWAKTDNISTGYLPATLQVQIGTETVGIEQVASVNDWSLYQAQYSAKISVAAPIAMYYLETASSNVWIDDIRVAPLDAQSTAYVYNRDNHRLMATFDDQNFGLFYQYDAEGKLTRKLVETEKGIKTVQETQYNTPLTVARPN